MPIPSPNENESQSDFVSRCHSALSEEFKDEKQRNAVCMGAWRKGKKEVRFSYKSILECKSLDDALIVKGYIATTHFDGQDVITKETLLKWAKEINEGNPRANKVSVNHNREPHVAGVGIKGTARVEQLPDGHWGLYVETRVDATREDYSEIKYRIENDFLDSYSIEYVAPEETRTDALTGARILDTQTELYGWTLASQPMNEHAVMVKEILGINHKEAGKMSDEVDSKAAGKEAKEQVAREPETKSEERLSAEDTLLLREYKELKSREVKEAEYKGIIAKVKEELKGDLSKMKVENKTLININVENKEILEFKEAVKADSKIAPEAQFSIAGKMADKLGLTSDSRWADGLRRDSKTVFARAAEGKFQPNLGRMEYKLGITTNQNTDTDYLLSAAEFADVFDPVIYNYLNWKITTWNMLQKDDYSMKGNNQVQFTVVTSGNTSAGYYTGNAVTAGDTGRKKYMTKFKKCQVGVEIDGDAIAAARGGPVGDLFAQAVKDGTDYMMTIMNAACYAEVGLETAAGIIGFEYITDSAGNTTLYNITRSGDSYLAPTTATDTYINMASADISKANLKKAIRQAREKGADDNNLMFFTSPIQYDKIADLYEDQQRIMTNLARFGFEGVNRMTFQGVPVFYDKDCNDDDIFLVDLETHRIGMWVAPTLEVLGKDSDSQKGFIKSYHATYNRCPNRMVQIYGCATS